MKAIMLRFVKDTSIVLGYEDANAKRFRFHLYCPSIVHFPDALESDALIYFGKALRLANGVLNVLRSQETL